MNTNRGSLTHMLQHIDETKLSEVAECETAPNGSLMDPRVERPHNTEQQKIGRGGGCRSWVSQ